MNEQSGGGGGGFGDLIALFAIFALFGGGGMFGARGGMGGVGSGATAGDVIAQQNFDTLDTRLAEMAANAASCCCQTQTAVLDAKYAALVNTKDLMAQDAACCCETNRNIDAVKTQMAADTCAIITSQTQLAKDAELREVYQRLNEAERLASEQRIIAAVTANVMPPRPVPAYMAASPYSTFTPNVNCVAPASASCAAVF